MRDDRLMWLVVVLLVATGAVAFWYYGAVWEPGTGKTAAPPAPDPTPAKTAPQRPQYPLQANDADNGSTRDLRPLPPLDESDGYFKLELVDLLGRASEKALVGSGLIERLVATVDNLPRQRVSERIRPLTGLDAQFVAGGQDDSGEFTLDEENFRRYDTLVEQFATADLQQAVELYRRYYPLFQKAYVGLGYPDGYFNDRLVEVIDHLLATPDVDGPISLTRPHVLYQFADPALEGLSGGQKLMLRLGPDNRERVRNRLLELRALIAAT